MLCSALLISVLEMRQVNVLVFASLHQHMGLTLLSIVICITFLYNFMSDSKFSVIQIKCLQATFAVHEYEPIITRERAVHLP